ncbi:MAG: VanZ family protein, partial [Pseudomonadota bacterium]
MSSQSTRQKPISRHVGALLCVLAATLAIHSIDSDRTSLILGGLRNAGHLPLFGALSLVVFSIVKSTARPYLTTVTVCLVIALISELSQMLTGGDVDWRDGVADSIGTALFLGAHRLWTQRTPLRAVLAGLLILLSVLPALFWSAQWALRRADAPCLITERWPLRRAVAQAFASTATRPANEPALVALTLDTRRYAGLRLHDPIADWRRFDALVLRARTAPGSEGPLTVR